MIISYVVAAILGLLLLGMAYQELGVRRDRKRFPSPGEFIELGATRIHIRKMGLGSPTVVLESGLMSTVLAWRDIQPELAESTRVVSYDRPGLGWSEAGSEPRDAAHIVEQLHALLDAAQISPPYVLVGHSFGGLTMPLFVARYPNEVAGAVLIDPVAPGEWNPPEDRDRRRIEIGSKICRRSAILARVGLLRLIASMIQAGAKPFANRVIRTISSGAPSDSNSTESPWFWNLPAIERSMAPVFWPQPKFCRAIASQLQHLPDSAAQVMNAGHMDKPLVVISAKNVPARRLAEHKSIAGQSPRGRHITADRSGHWVTEDQPQLVIDTILEIVDLSRSTGGQKTRVAHGA